MKSQKYRIDSKDYDVTVNSFSGNHAEVTVNGTVYQVEIVNDTAKPAAAVPIQTPQISAEPASGISTPKESPAPDSGPDADGKPVCSPLPGVIVSVNVKAGERVKAGQTVAVLEAMKMENEIQAESDGVVTSVEVTQGDSILEGAVIVTIG